jgi:hypothetical protein
MDMAFKGFAFSMIEAATEFDDGRLSIKEIQTIIRYAKSQVSPLKFKEKKCSNNL